MLEKYTLELNDGPLTQVVALLGADRFCILVDILAERLKHIVSRLECGVKANSLIALVHQSHGSAGSLGLLQSATSLKELERLMLTTCKNSDQLDNNEAATRLVLIEQVSAILAQLQSVRPHIFGL